MLSLLVAVAGALAPRAAAVPAVGGLASDGVEYVDTVPLDAGGAQQARLLGKRLYLASWRGFSIYDVSDPLAPEQLSTVHMGHSFPNESLDTNGEVLVLQEQTPREIFRVYDVSDKEAPALLAELPGVADHTVECVLGCKWVYGSSGTIIDLRDPRNPVVAGDWSGGTLQFGHTVSEVSPGIVLTTSLPSLRVLDARANPARPKLLADTPAPTDNVQGVSLWPRRGRDRILLSAEESSFSARCSEETSAFVTYDTTDWRRRGAFRLLDQFRLANGTVEDGSVPAGALGCSTHAFDEHPDFRDGGLVALAHYENGTRFLRVGGDGTVTEAGWFLPYGGETSATVWVTPEVVYAIDVVRGIDVLRVSPGLAS